MNRESVVLDAAAALLCDTHFCEISESAVAAKARLPVEEVLRSGGMLALGIALLDLERAAMQDAQDSAKRLDVEPLETLGAALEFAFGAIATRLDVRAGIRIAMESHGQFPKRGGPYRRWAAFITEQLQDAVQQGQLRSTMDTDVAASALIAVGLGSCDLARLSGDWKNLVSDVRERAAILLDVPITVLGHGSTWLDSKP